MSSVRRLFADTSILIGAALLASDSRAGATIDLLFVGVNGAPIAPTSSVTPMPGDHFTMAVVMRNDEPLTLAWFSLNYDLDGDDELDVVYALQWRGVAINQAGTDFFEPLGRLFPITSTFVGSFVGATTNLSLPRTLPPAGGAFAGGYQMGTVLWRVNAGLDADGVDIVSGILDPRLDAFGDPAFNNISDRVLGNSASVNTVPEPAAAALLGLGLLGLLLLRRRGATQRGRRVSIDGEGRQ